MVAQMSAIQNIVILTGAGISAESGPQTFRASDGLWCDHRVEDVATPEAFERDPALVQRFYNMRRAQLKEVEPNAAHLALAELCRDWPHGEVTLVTQNVDDLHGRALTSLGVSTRHLIHMHGELLKARHLHTGDITSCDHDLEPGVLRPHIVWFGEMPLEMERIDAALDDCDLFLSIGTSGNVYPAAGFVAQAHAAGAHTAEINLEPSQGANLFAQHIYGPATQTVPAFVQQLLKT
jgi:NAD-dependent deacetylase